MPSKPWRNCLLALAGVIAFGCVARADEKKKDETTGKGPTIIQIDISKLPPDVQKELLKAIVAQGKKEEKKEEKKTTPAKNAISLSDAIKIAEKIGNGQAVKAESKGEGNDLTFKIEVLGKGGEKKKIELDASGKPLATTGKEEEKGKPKKKDEDKDEKGNKKDEDKDEKGNKTKKGGDEDEKGQKGKKGEDEDEKGKKGKKGEDEDEKGKKGKKGGDEDEKGKKNKKDKEDD
jgi:hypothetical protein